MLGEEGLINFIFRENNATLDMQLGGLDTPKDLFKFCMHFLWRGLVVLYGNGGDDDEDVDLEALSFDDFLIVQQKLKNVGIKCNLTIDEVEADMVIVPNINTQLLLNTVHMEMDRDESKTLADYSFDLQTSKHILKISFEIFHSVSELPKNKIR
jgi:hypothetical protein